MKTYEKPRLVALAVSSNDLLCQSCAVDVIGDNRDPVFDKYLELIGGSIEQLFGSGETSCVIPVEGYCKFLGTNVVINS